MLHLYLNAARVRRTLGGGVIILWKHDWAAGRWVCGAVAWRPVFDWAGACLRRRCGRLHAAKVHPAANVRANWVIKYYVAGAKRLFWHRTIMASSINTLAPIHAEEAPKPIRAVP